MKRYALSMYPHAQYTNKACTAHVSRMHFSCILYALKMYDVCSVYVCRLLSPCRMQNPYMRYTNFIYSLCTDHSMVYVLSMYDVCAVLVYVMHCSCIHVTMFMYDVYTVQVRDAHSLCSVMHFNFFGNVIRCPSMSYAQ